MSSATLDIPRSLRHGHDRTFTDRIRVLVSSAVACVFGLLPHVLHHAGPLAGAALFAGAAGSLLFGAIGLIAAIPFLLRIHRHCGNWRVPAATLAAMAAVFSLSTFVIGPAIAGGGDDGTSSSPSQSAPAPDEPSGHDAHH